MIHIYKDNREYYVGGTPEFDRDLKDLIDERYIIVERPFSEDRIIDKWIMRLSSYEDGYVISIESTEELKTLLMKEGLDETEFRVFMETAYAVLNIRGGKQ